jgi:hypothetical protein
MSDLSSLESVQFMLGATVYAYGDGRVDITSWGEHGGIGLVGWGGLRRLGEDEQEARR